MRTRSERKCRRMEEVAEYTEERKIVGGIRRSRR